MRSRGTRELRLALGCERQPHRVFACQTGLSRHVVVYDVATGTSVVIEPPTVHFPFQTVITGDTVAFADAVPPQPGSPDEGAYIQVADVSAPTAPVTNLSGSPAVVGNVRIAPHGNLVVWEACTNPVTDCDVVRAVRSGGVWGPAQVVAGTTNFEVSPDTDGVSIVYVVERPSA